MKLLHYTTCCIYLVMSHKTEAYDTFALDGKNATVMKTTLENDMAQSNNISSLEKPIEGTKTPVDNENSGSKSTANLDDNNVALIKTTFENRTSESNNVSSLDRPIKVTNTPINNGSSSFQSSADLDDSKVALNKTTFENPTSQPNNVSSLEKPLNTDRETLVNNIVADLDDKTGQVNENGTDISPITLEKDIGTDRSTLKPSDITVVLEDKSADIKMEKDNKPRLKNISDLNSQIEVTIGRHEFPSGCLRIANYINENKNNSWQAVAEPQPNADSGLKIGPFKGTLPQEDQPLCPTADCKLPIAYDTRTSYPMCVFLQEPLDQGCNCRAGWAMGAASALSDRFCIITGGALDQQFSAQNVLSCCKYCGGCEGGYSEDAWYYLLNQGVVSGSPYGHTTGCQPYLIKPCMVGDIPQILIDTPKCSQTCRTSSKNSPPFVYKASRVYTLRNISANAIKAELFFRGPVTANINIYEDFQCYKSGIYNHVTGDHVGYKTVKFVGWGEEKGVPYWVAANTWGSSWGENGFFRIRMDVEDIITYISAGIPQLFEIATRS